ncbi:hypothetical protein [Comamonas thiooxydans]|uniref:hypothetical protein n=1 Tax=Comamonas thiooxydans TaxID=363952 RepID=UPI00057A6611|nr:hypothetical protein [Comamonas thiooxydans]
MPDFSISSILDWLNSNGAVVSLCTAAFGFWGGLRTNMLTARRAEWNAVVDRVRAGLLRSRNHSSISLPISVEDEDLLMRLACWWRRGRIRRVIDQYSEIRGQSQRDSETGAVFYTSKQEQEMQWLREQLLTMVQRR